MKKPSIVLLRTKLKPVENTSNYVEPCGRVCAVGALVVGAGYGLHFSKADGRYLTKDGKKIRYKMLEEILRENYKLPMGFWFKILRKFHETKDLKAVGMWLKELGY